MRHERKLPLVGITILVNRQADLPHVICALGSSGGAPRSLNGRQEQTHEQSDNGDNDQQLHQRERWFASHGTDLAQGLELQADACNWPKKLRRP
jgi:hypothetical protein